MRFGHWIASTVVAISLSDSAHAHLGNRPISEAERVSRELAAVNSRRLLENCINSDAGRQLQEKAIARRLAMLHSYTNHRRLDVSTALATNHMSNLTGLSSTTDPSTLFSSTPACLLEPEVTEGPYYVAGELVRSDIRESQPGIDLYMDLQFIDITSCKPVNNLYVDFWHANSSGVYSGVVASTNGNSKDASNVNSTFHRGLSPTDSNGFVSFATKFPGFYTGRTTHVHIMTHYNGTLNNRRYTGGHVSHVGQLFFDQSLLTTVQGTGVYANNKNQATKNADDNIVKQAAANAFDPFVKRGHDAKLSPECHQHIHWEWRVRYYDNNFNKHHDKLDDDWLDLNGKHNDDLDKYYYHRE
ncbi:hypothetical protein PHYBOEH_005302 [Phytophthora boehmeriae]|uniref:Intradiol ring-cleavage dioxygenases domain-containing protein n=1 Tax=Phytophthora boehmeriae TaxID=109152 RepID=A0A8T1WQZ7_9STRA|nr:hypothetical protein PHYBOEH_005302 [Phytophthora boehmeriae]